MTTRQWIDAAVEHLRAHRTAFGACLAPSELARVEAALGVRFPLDFRLFL
jgi:hypothetical protein